MSTNRPQRWFRRRVPPPPQAALVISGGGSKGAFAVGAVRSLYERFIGDGWFTIVGGSSTGSLIAPFAALLADAALADAVLEDLVTVYATVRTRDILERHGPIESILRKGSLTEAEPLRKIIDAQLTPERFDALTRSDMPNVYIVYTSFTTGQAVTVSPRDPGMTREKFVSSMLASASVPVFMQATIIDGESCYDGCARDVLPLNQAVDRGAELIVPIYLDPEYLPIAEKPLLRLDRVLFRSVAIMLDEILRNDVQQALTVQAGVHLRERLLAAFGRWPWQRHRLKRVIDDPAFADLIGSHRRLRSVLPGIRPQQTMTDEPLKFEPEQMRRWMEQGASQARATVTESPFTACEA